MKKISIILLVIIVLFLTGIYVYTKHAMKHNSSSSLPVVKTSLDNTPNYCLPQDVQATLTLSHGEGNVYGIFTLQNISDKKCQIVGNHVITVNYDTQAIKNISIMRIGTPENNLFLLSPNQTIYSQVHYPNGPQCSSGIQTAKINFTYLISPSNTVTFMDQTKRKEQNITICTAVSDITTVQLWNISSKPITP